jgi:hypothetical protein
MTLVRDGYVDLPDTYYTLRYTIDRYLDIKRVKSVTVVDGSTLKWTHADYYPFLKQDITISIVDIGLMINYSTGNVTFADGAKLKYTYVDYYQFLKQDIWINTQSSPIFTPIGTNIPVDFPDVGVNLTFDNVTWGGSTTVIKTQDNPGGSLPSGFKVVGIFYDISTTAIFTENVRICLTGFDVKADYKLFHWTNTKWKDVTTSVDADNDMICGTVSSLSPFVVMEQEIVSRPTAAGGGAAPSCLKEGFQSLDVSLLKCVLKQLGLQYKQFYTGIEPVAGIWPQPVGILRALASILAITGDKTGEYPAPELDVSTYLQKPVKVLEGDVYALAAEKVQKRWTVASTVVIARGDLEVDSLAAIAYAKARGVPILLTKPGEPPDVTLEAIEKLGTKKIVIAGGPVAVSEVVEEELKKIAEVERIWGENREETAVKLARAVDEFTTVDSIVVADGLKPSPEVAIIANGYKAPIVYVSGDAVPEVTMEYLEEHKKTLDVYKKPVKVVFVGVSEGLQEEIEGIMGS